MHVRTCTYACIIMYLYLYLCALYSLPSSDALITDCLFFFFRNGKSYSIGSLNQKSCYRTVLRPSVTLKMNHQSRENSKWGVSNIHVHVHAAAKTFFFLFACTLVVDLKLYNNLLLHIISKPAK